MGVELDQESFARGWARGMGTPTPPIDGAFGEFDAEDLDEIAVTLTGYAGMPVGNAFSMLSRRLQAEIAAEAGDA